MKKQRSPLTKKPSHQQLSVPEADTRPFARTFVIKKNKLPYQTEITADDKLENKQFRSDEFHKLVKANRAMLFGERTLGMSATIGGSPFDSLTFLFDFSEGKPRCFILSMILSGAHFDSFFMELTRIFGFLRNTDNRMKIIDVLKKDIEADKVVVKAVRAFIGKETPISLFLSETILARCRVLLLADGQRAQLPELVETYPEVWRSMFSVIYLQKFQVGKVSVLAMTPSFSDINDKPKNKEKKPREPKVEHNEAHHFAKSSRNVQDIYEKLKVEARKIAPKVHFNPSGKHYIAMKNNGGNNLAFLHFRKGGLYTVVKVDEKIVRGIVKKNVIHSLPPSVQKFWNGKSTGITIVSLDHMKEIVVLLKKLIKG